MKDSRMLATLVLFLGVAQAATAHTIPLFVSVDATTLFTRLGQTQSINLINNLGNTYVADKHWDNKTTVMFGAGATTYQKNNLIFNTGLRYLSTSNFLLNGNVWQMNSAAFNNLAYQYRVKSDLILVENAISYAKNLLLQPSFILGLGYASNTADSYQVSALYNHASEPLQTFSGKRSAQLAYEIGAGLDYFVLKPAVIELAYRFIGAGKGYLGYSPLQNTTARLSTGNIYYHTISLGIRLYYDHTY
ncbi:MAG: hypothetical protein QNK11_00995 [Legionella sp.]|nr:hypothetical protein [Legionella sp.]